MSMLEIIREQLMEYNRDRKEAERELVRRMKAGEDYEQVGQKVMGLRALEEECVRMMAKHTKEARA